MYQIGVFFQKVSRFFFSRVSGTCWNCGQKCGMGTIARGFMWCNECYARYQSFIRDPHFVFSIRHFGYPASGLTKRALDALPESECPYCHEKFTGTYGDHVLQKAERQ